MVITNVNQVVYRGDGSNTAFPFTFKIQDASEINLQLVYADGTVTDITSDFYVDMVNSTVHYPGYAPGSEPAEANRPAPVQTGQKLTIWRDVPMTQESDLGDKWPFHEIEDGLDKLTMICQQIYSYTNRKLDAALASMFQLAGIVTDSGKLQHITEQYNAIDANAAAAAESEENAAASETAAANSAAAAAESDTSARTTATALTNFLATKETLPAPAVDPTLSISGAAADALVTGNFTKHVGEVRENLFDAEQFLLAGWTKNGDEYTGTLTQLNNMFSISKGGFLFPFSNFKANTRYIISFQYYSEIEGGTGNGGHIEIEYLDGTTQAMMYISNSYTDWRTVTAITTEGKTVDKIYYAPNSLQTAMRHIRYFTIVEAADDAEVVGTNLYPYSPYGLTAKDGKARKDADYIANNVSKLKRDVKWGLGAFNANGSFDKNIASASCLVPITSIHKIVVTDQWATRLLLYNEGQYLGKLNTYGGIDTASGHWKYFTGEIYVQEIFDKFGADAATMILKSPEGVTVTADNVKDLAETNCAVYVFPKEDETQAKLISHISTTGINLFNGDWLLEAAGWTKNGDEYVGNLNDVFMEFANPNALPFKDDFEENTQYTLSYRYYNEGTSETSTNEFYIRCYYTDGTSANISNFNRNAHDWVNVCAFTVADKTIDHISVHLNSNANNIYHIKEISLYKGNIRRAGHMPTYIPYEDSANDKYAREQLAMLGNLAIPDYYSNYEDAVDNARVDMGNAGKDGFSFIFSTDQHWERNMQTSPAMIRDAVKKLNLQTIVLCGDLLNGQDGLEKKYSMKLLADGFAAYNQAENVLPVRGNHDGNDVGQHDDSCRLNANELFGVLCQGLVGKVNFYAIEASDDTGAHNRIQYFYDIPDLKTRCIIMDTYLEGIGMRTAQMEWMEDALNSAPDDYRIIIFAHIFFEAGDWSVHGNAIKTRVDAFNANSTGAKVVAMFGGHNHKDHNELTDTGVNLIVTDCDSPLTNSDVGATKMTIDDMCFDIVTINYRTKTINCRRVGRGQDRMFTWNY